MKPITRNQFALAEQVRNRFAISLEPGATLKELLKEEATQLIAAHLARGAIVEVTTEDQAWFAELLVKDAGRNYAKFHVIRFVELLPPAVAADDPEAKADADADASAYVVNWGGPSQKFRVIRKADGAVMQAGFADKAAGEAWANEHAEA